MSTKVRTPSQRITDEVTSWPGVEAGPGRRGEFAFRVGRREIGHLHGDRAAHFGFPKDVGAALRREGRVGPHPVAPDKPAWAARSITTDEDVADVIELLRLNYDRVTGLRGVLASTPEPLPFAPSLDIRAFLLERAAGNILIYSVKGLERDADGIADRGGIARHYLNHWHEALFPSSWAYAKVFVHEADRDEVAERMPVRATFSRRHVLDEDFEVIPIPGHTPGATAYLWHNGNDRILFTGDTLYLSDGEWVPAVLDSSDRSAYRESLALIRDLDFDVLVPWAATHDGPWYARTDPEDRRRRIDAILERL